VNTAIERKIDVFMRKRSRDKWSRVFDGLHVRIYIGIACSIYTSIINERG